MNERITEAVEFMARIGEAIIIGLCNSKGGPGKSTIALNLAIMVYDLGKSVGFIDAEEYAPQAEVLTKYEPGIQVRAATTTIAIDDALHELKQNCEVVVLDSPGKTGGEEVATICTLADLVIVPIKTSRKDLRQTKPVLRMIKNCQDRQQGKPEVVIVLNETHKRSVAARAYRDQLSAVGLEIAQSEIRLNGYHKQNDFVTRNPKLPDGPRAAEDMKSLFDEVIVPRLSAGKVAVNG